MTGAALSHRFCIAPMLDWTDRHCRYFLRLISRHTMLYTEMVTTGALLHGDAARFLRYDPAEHPVALQLGGSDPAEMAAAARLGEAAGYDEVNINVGCPSDRVQSGRFGACLMADPGLVAELVSAMSAAVAIPVTVKTRIGIDDQDSYEALQRFVATVSAAGCRTFVVHARKAWLEGLSPKENREIPPLRYDIVARLKQDFPDLEIVLNGGIPDLDQAADHLRTFDGVMLGRAVYHDPWLLADVDERFFGEAPRSAMRHDVLEAWLPQVQRELDAGVPLARMTRHVLGLFNGLPGARAWRRYLSENAHRPGAGVEVVRVAASRVGAQNLIKNVS